MWESEFPMQLYTFLGIDSNFFVLAGLMDDTALKVYDTFAYHVTQANFNHRVKTVSLWTLQMTASAVLAALRNVVDPASVQRWDIRAQH
jgi:hypothetical protein